MSPESNLNGDLSRRVVCDTNEMEWTASPSGSVSRKRVHLVGPPEAGQVTSVVRYTPGATFPAHDHPDGEEILVLQGVFSDEHGDWPAGTYLLNPEGFHHAPFSKNGCLLFVKLRQFPGDARDHIVLDHEKLEWRATDRSGVEQKLLYQQPRFEDTSALERWSAGAEPGATTHTNGSEVFVLEGSFGDEHATYPAGTWLRLPVGFEHQPTSKVGCTLYVKRGGFAYLEDGSS